MSCLESISVRTCGILAGIVLMIGALGSGCAFKSGLTGNQCQQNGEREDGRVCRGGYWVELEDVDDGDSGPVDVGPDNCNYEGESLGVCRNGTVDDAGNCTAPASYESEETSCMDGLDNDCDGKTDEDDAQCECSPGDEKPCYSGPSGTKGEGLCEAGQRTCNSQGIWGECKGETTPVEEVCKNGKDEDCGGDGDAGCPCNYGGNEKGVCGGATVGADGSCQKPDGYQATNNEKKAGLCNDQLDNDCDGVVNEHCDCQYNDKSAGVCGEATIAPDSDTGVCKKPAAYDSTEDESNANKCDAKDNDCDGKTDEGCDECSPKGETKSFYSGPEGTEGVGICRAGEFTCQSNGSWKVTTEEKTPKEMETCDDSQDTDCNGADSNGCSCPYESTSDGVCGNATRDSNGNCQEPGGYESTETSCTDGLDNDCDTDKDASDSDCQCNYDGESAGVCGEATRDNSGDCQEPMGYESAETSCLDESDNDCDGSTDANDSDCQCNYDGESAGVCGDATRDDSGNCQEPSAYESPEASCGDASDNDCDSDTDCSDGDCTGLECDGTGTVCRTSDGDCHETACGDGNDNDSDGSTDCEDADCDGSQCHGSGTTCQQGDDTCHETVCDDGNDNDGDRSTDCEDGDCNGSKCDGSGTTCQRGDDTCHETACDDGADNDGDRDTDCADSDCDGAQCTESKCGDGNDNDGDDDTDCKDSDCTGLQCDGSGTACKAGDSICHETACEDGSDNDSNGDPDCQDATDCPRCPPGTICTSGGRCAENDCGDTNDNDTDGNPDCEDSDCDGDPCGSNGCCSSANSSCSPSKC